MTPVSKGTYLLLLYSDHGDSDSPYVIDGYLATDSMLDKADFNHIMGLTASLSIYFSRNNSLYLF